MNQDLQQFLYPKARYSGPFSPDRFLFNANLQEFAQQVEYISNLHAGGKLSSEDALKKIDSLWQILVRSRPEGSEDNRQGRMKAGDFVRLNQSFSPNSSSPQLYYFGIVVDVIPDNHNSEVLIHLYDPEKDKCYIDEFGIKAIYQFYSYELRPLNFS